MSSFQWIYLSLLLRDLQASTVWGYLFDDDGKYPDRARTLFIWVFQLWQPPFHCRSCVCLHHANSSPIPVPHFFHWDLAFLSVMCYQWGCRRCLGLPNYLPLSLFLLAPPLSTASVYLPPPPRSSVSTQLFTVRSLFSLGFLFLTFLICLFGWFWYFLLGLSYF